MGGAYGCTAACGSDAVRVCVLSSNFTGRRFGSSTSDNDNDSGLDDIDSGPGEVETLCVFS